MERLIVRILLVDFVVQAVVTIFTFDNTDAEHIGELTTNRVDLLIDLASNFAYIKCPVWVVQKQV